jgi:hypothetical protein
MKLVAAFCAVVLASSASTAEARLIRAAENTNIRVAQSYCGQCNDARISCVAKCNGSGTCIQKCDDDYLNCLEQNFCRARR